MATPLAVIIDIDGTLIGDITSQAVEWQLVTQYNKTCLRQFRTMFIDVLKTNITRPYFANFMNGITNAFPNVEFFVYTASEHKWANFLVPCLEEAINVRFNRPIFTRNHMVVDPKTGAYFKSLTRILPLINKTVKRKSQTANLTISQCILIDNNSTLLMTEKHHLLLCPTYRYTIHNDVLRYIPVSVLKQNMVYIMNLLKDTGLLPRINMETNNIETFYVSYYDHLGKNVVAKYPMNIVKDKMWVKALSAFKDYLSSDVGRGRQDFNVKFIKDLNKKLFRFRIVSSQ